MNSHKNAKTTPLSRAEMVRRVRVEGQPVARVAAAYGVSERTVYNWLERFREEGVEGLENRSSRPYTLQSQFIDGWTELIVRLRHYRLTALEIADQLGFPRSTVAALLKRLGLNRLSRLTPPEPVRRYERRRPGDLIHIDIKKLARFKQIGHRITGDRRKGRSRKVGYEYVHVCVDDHSRVAYVEVLPDETGQTCADFLARAVLWFAKKGITVRRVMSDNGAGYKSGIFRLAREALGLLHLLTRPYTPKTNGKAERFIKTMLEDWAYALPYKTSDRRNAHLPRWLRIYNHERPHASLAGAPPITRLTAQA